MSKVSAVVYTRVHKIERRDVVSESGSREGVPDDAEYWFGYMDQERLHHRVYVRVGNLPDRKNRT